MKRLATILFVFFLSLSYAQKPYFTYEAINSDETFSFPIFHNTNNLLATEKINQLLQISELRLLKGFEKENIFENVTVDDHTIYGRKIAIDDTILNNSDKNLSVSFRESSCGMTCHYWTVYYNFNSSNGDMIYLEDIVVDSLYGTFHKYIATKVSDLVKRGFYKDTPDSCYQDPWCSAIWFNPLLIGIGFYKLV